MPILLLPDAVTCAALLLGCEGGLGPVHYRAVGKFDFSGFRFIERRHGVSLAERTRVSGGGGDTTSYRALAGWIDHSFFLLKTPGIEVASEENRVSENYYGAYSIGNAIDSNPDVLAGGAAMWSGVMVGVRIAEPDGFVKGDARITVSNPQGNLALLVDVEFSNMNDEQTGADFDDVSWEGLALKDGSFGCRFLSATARRMPVGIPRGEAFPAGSMDRTMRKWAACSVSRRPLLKTTKGRWRCS